MSLDPRWYSTIYGMIFIAGQGLGALCVTVIASGSFLSRYKPFQKIATINTFHDLGNLMMAFTILWAYTSFSTAIDFPGRAQKPGRCKLLLASRHEYRYQFHR